MPVHRGSAPSYKQVYRGGTPVRQIYRGNTLVWQRTAVSDGFDWDGWLDNWINELCSGEDIGDLISDGLGGIVDGIGNVVGQTVAFVEGGANGLGKLVANTGTSLVDAYCGAWGGTSPPNGLIGLVNGIPIFGPILADWLEGDLDIDSIIGELPVFGPIAKQIGLIPDDLGNLLDPINYVVDAAGDVVGTITCGKYKNIGGGALEGICYVIGVVNQSARMMVPDGLLNLDRQIGRMRHPTLLTSDDGWLDIQVAEQGSPDMVTQVFRRYANDGSGARGVGIDLRNNMASIVRRVGGVETLVAPNLSGFGPATRFRLEQLGNVHTLIRDGIPVGEWPDNTATAASGANNRSVAMVMQGAKELWGARRFSPSLNYVEAG
ncbi:hypothetical protein SEA_KNOCKER_43 [Mycobacterium phage Knocker]|nr:hypothetical protein SEA_KNOCKER_43 [Mycobacterium phage Knocker]